MTILSKIVLGFLLGLLAGGLAVLAIGHAMGALPCPVACLSLTVMPGFLGTVWGAV